MPEDPYAYVVAAFQAPPSLDYVPGPEYPPSPEFVPEPVYPEFMPPEDTAVLPTANSPATPPPHPAYRVIARISIRDETPISLPPREEVERLLGMPTLPSSPLSLWSSPLPQIPSPPLPPILSPLPVSPPLPQIPSPPLPVSSPVPVLSPSPLASPIRSLGYRAAMIRLRAEAASTSHSLPLPPPIILSHTRPDAPSSGILPMHLLSTDRRADRARLLLLDRLEVLGQTMETDEIYTRLDDEQTKRQLLAGQLNMLFRDRRAHARTTRLMEAEARMSREAEARMSREAWG
ncbi:hypothetical protein Tco_1529256 [Tanacetum coccineum]